MATAPDGLIKVVYEDLKYILESWPSGEISDAELRRSSTVLRRFLTYQDLMTVWVTVVGQTDYLVEGAYLELEDPKLIHQVQMAFCSKARHGTGVNHHYGAVIQGRVGEMAKIRDIRVPNMPIKRYLDKTACILGGMKLTRNDIVQFVANELGGAHYGEGKQRPTEVALRTLKGTVGERDLLYHELLSYGQTVAAAQSTADLMQAIRTRLSIA